MNTPTNTQDTTLFQAAYLATAADRSALSPADFATVNLDAQTVINTVVGVMPKLKSLRSEIASRLPKADISALDKIESYAYALAHAQTEYMAASAPTEILPELGERASKLREILLSDAKALALRGLIETKPLEELKGGTGYLNIAYDLGALVRMLRGRWDTIGTKSAIQPSELDEAQKIFERITLTVAERSQQSAKVATASEDRQRAFTLLVKCYDEVRRIITYVRWTMNDADKISPSLYAGRGGRGANNVDAQSKVDPHAVTEPGPVPLPITSPTAAAVPAGMPGGSPFTEN